jgi:hypothetical protein
METEAVRGGGAGDGATVVFVAIAKRPLAAAAVAKITVTIFSPTLDKRSTTGLSIADLGHKDKAFIFTLVLFYLFCPQ